MHVNGCLLIVVVFAVFWLGRVELRHTAVPGTGNPDGVTGRRRSTGRV